MQAGDDVLRQRSGDHVHHLTGRERGSATATSAADYGHWLETAVEDRRRGKSAAPGKAAKVWRAGATSDLNLEAAHRPTRGLRYPGRNSIFVYGHQIQHARRLCVLMCYRRGPCLGADLRLDHLR